MAAVSLLHRVQVLIAVAHIAQVVMEEAQRAITAAHVAMPLASFRVAAVLLQAATTAIHVTTIVHTATTALAALTVLIATHALQAAIIVEATAAVAAAIAAAAVTVVVVIAVVEATAVVVMQVDANVFPLFRVNVLSLAIINS